MKYLLVPYPLLDPHDPTAQDDNAEDMEKTPEKVVMLRGGSWEGERPTKRDQKLPLRVACE